MRRWLPESDQDILFDHTRVLGVPSGRWRKELEGLGALEKICPRPRLSATPTSYNTVNL